MQRKCWKNEGANFVQFPIGKTEQMFDSFPLFTRFQALTSAPTPPEVTNKFVCGRKVSF